MKAHWDHAGRVIVNGAVIWSNEVRPVWSLTSWPPTYKSTAPARFPSATSIERLAPRPFYGQLQLPPSYVHPIPNNPPTNSALY
jgi:hypothetical protein